MPMNMADVNWPGSKTLGGLVNGNGCTDNEMFWSAELRRNNNPVIHFYRPRLKTNLT